MEKQKTKTTSDWASILLLAGSFIVTLFTFGYYLSKVAQGKAVPEDAVKVVLYGILAPYILTTIALYLIKTQFERVRGGFEETNSRLVEKFSDEILRPLKIDLINAIKPTAHYNVILNHPRKAILEKFIPKILDDFERKLAHISMGHVYEHDPSKYHAFAMDIFELAKDKIIATSAVDPTGFWDDPMTLSYLEKNKQIVKKKVDFTRYFFVNDENKDASLSAIANNMRIGVKVYVIIDDENFDKDYKIDACLIDDNITAISDLDKKDNIRGVDAYIDDEAKVPFIRDWTKFLDSKKVEVTSVYSDMTEEQIKEKATIPLRDE